MKNPRSFLSLIFLAFLAVLLAACGKNPGTASTQPGSKAAGVASGNHLSMKLNDKDWVADHNLFGAFHPKGHNKAILISGSKGPKDKDEQVFSLNLFNVDGPGTCHIKTGNAEQSVAQMANLSAENYIYGSLMGFDVTVIVTKATKDPTVIEATFEGTLTGNADDTLKVTDGRFIFRE